MPGEEEASQMDLSCFLDVDDGVVLISIDGDRELTLVEVRWLAVDTVDGVHVGFSFFGRHAGEADTRGLDV